MEGGSFRFLDPTIEDRDPENDPSFGSSFEQSMKRRPIVVFIKGVQISTGEAVTGGGTY